MEASDTTAATSWIARGHEQARAGTHRVTRQQDPGRVHVWLRAHPAECSADVLGEGRHRDDGGVVTSSVTAGIQQEHRQPEGEQRLRDGQHVDGAAAPAVDHQRCRTGLCGLRLTQPPAQDRAIHRTQSDIDGIEGDCTRIDRGVPPRRMAEDPLHSAVGGHRTCPGGGDGHNPPPPSAHWCSDRRCGDGSVPSGESMPVRRGRVNNREVGARSRPLATNGDCGRAGTAEARPVVRRESFEGRKTIPTVGQQGQLFGHFAAVGLTSAEEPSRVFTNLRSPEDGLTTSRDLRNKIVILVGAVALALPLTAVVQAPSVAAPAPATTQAVSQGPLVATRCPRSTGSRTAGPSGKRGSWSWDTGVNSTHRSAGSPRSTYAGSPCRPSSSMAMSSSSTPRS